MWIHYVATRNIDGMWEIVQDMGSEEILLTTGKLLLEFYLIMT